MESFSTQHWTGLKCWPGDPNDLFPSNISTEMVKYSPLILFYNNESQISDELMSFAHTYSPQAGSYMKPHEMHCTAYVSKEGQPTECCFVEDLKAVNAAVHPPPPFCPSVVLMSCMGL